MKTIYLLQKVGRYSTAPKILRAFENRRVAEDLIELMKGVDVEDLVIVELALHETPKL